MNIQMRFPSQAGAEAQHWKIFVPPPHGQLSSSYPEEFRPYRPQIPPPFTQIGPRLAPSSHLTSPPDFQQSPFLAVRFNESSQTRELGGDYQFSDVEKDQADTYLLIMKNVSAISKSDCHLPLVLPPSPTYPEKVGVLAFFLLRTKFCSGPFALRCRFWEFRIGERLKNMINFKCIIKATILIMYR